MMGMIFQMWGVGKNPSKILGKTLQGGEMKRKVDFGIVWFWFYSDWYKDYQPGGGKTPGSCSVLSTKKGRRCASIWIDSSVNMVTKIHVICHELIHVGLWILLGWCGSFHWYLQHGLDRIDYLSVIKTRVN